MVRITIPLFIASLAFTVTPSLAVPVFEDGHQPGGSGNGVTVPSQGQELRGPIQNPPPTIKGRSVAFMAGIALAAIGNNMMQKNAAQKEPAKGSAGEPSNSERREFETYGLAKTSDSVGGDDAATPLPSDRTNQSLLPTLQVAVHMVIKAMQAFGVGTYGSSETSKGAGDIGVTPDKETNQGLPPTLQVALYMASKEFLRGYDIAYVEVQRPHIQTGSM